METGCSRHDNHRIADADYALQNSMGSNIESLYKLNDNRVEALEFVIREDCPLVRKAGLPPPQKDMQNAAVPDRQRLPDKEAA